MLDRSSRALRACRRLTGGPGSLSFVESDLLDLVLGASLEPDQIIPGLAAGFDELVDLCLERGPVSILGRLQNRQQEQSHNADRNVSTGNEQFVSGEIGCDPSACQKHADKEHLGTACEPGAPRRKSVEELAHGSLAFPGMDGDTGRASQRPQRVERYLSRARPGAAAR